MHFLALPSMVFRLTKLVAYVPQFSKDLEIVSYLWLPLVIDIRVTGRAIENLGERGPRVESQKRRDVAGGRETPVRGG